MAFADERKELHVMLGMPLDAVGFGEAIAIIDKAIVRRQRLLISTPNLSFFTQAAQNLDFRRSLFASDLCLADGAPVIWLARLLSIPLPGRVAGSDLFEALKARPAGPEGRPIRVYFFGGPEGAAAEAAARLNKAAGGVSCAGWAYPGYRSVAEMSDDATLSAINESAADLLVVALGARKGQEWLLRNHHAIHVPVRVHLGAVINFEAGSIQRAPSLFRRFGLEWLWRIKEEPALARRYAADFGTLARLLAKGVAPRFMRPGPGLHGTGLAITTASAGGTVRIGLKGHAGMSDRSRIAAAFAEALESGEDAVLDCRDLKYLDPSGLGLLARLRAALANNSRALRIEGLSGQPQSACHDFGVGEILFPAGASQ